MYTPRKMLSYSQAYSKWESIKPVRGRSDQSTRPLARRGNDNLTIRHNPANGDVIVTLYRTDLITYHTDGLITIEPYASALTNRIMSCILGHYIRAYWADRDYRTPDFITEVGGRYYNTPGLFVVDPRKTPWVLGAGSKPFMVPRLDRSKAAKTLRETGYREFTTWLDTQIKLGVDPRTVRTGSMYKFNNRGIVECLRAGFTGWSDLVQSFSLHKPLEDQLRDVRRAVYEYESCIETEEVAYYEGWGELQSVLNRMKVYG